jgi:hypothetical protein
VEWDPGGWRQRTTAGGGGGDGDGDGAINGGGGGKKAAAGGKVGKVGKATTRALRAVTTSLGECAERLPAHTGPSLRLGGPFGKTPRHVLVVTDSGAALEGALRAWCVEVGLALFTTLFCSQNTNY